MRHLRTKQRGAALVVGLILLVVITLLAVVGMNIANTELASATSEQLRMRAFNAAETGLEARLQTLRLDANLAKTIADPEVRAAVAVENSPVNSATNAATDTFGTTTIYRGEGSLLSRYSAGTFHGFHFSVESTGRSARNAVSVHTAGAFQINGTGGGGFVFTQDNNAPPVNQPPP